MPRARRRAVAAPVVLIAALLATIAACDTTPGAPPLLPEPPALDAFEVTPDSFHLAGTDAVVTIPITIAGAVTSGGRWPVAVQYLVRRQGDDTLAVDGRMEIANDLPPQPATRITFSGQDQLILPRGASGLYLVEAVAVGPDGRAGGRASDLVRYSIVPLGPPTIAAVVLDPPVVIVPASGTARLRVAATVADPDGPANLGYVALQPAGGGPQLPMSDSGPVGQAGDAVPADGVYTVTLDVAAGTAPGQFQFEVVARDREGLEATPFPVTIVVQ